jgi:adenylosuccinate synthase
VFLQGGQASLVLGAQYGDEGKGKLVDELAEKAALVCRVQGGNNAGHTIWVKGEKLVTHLMPSGVLHPKCQIALGAGVVIDPLVLTSEMEMILSKGVPLTPQRFWIDARAHVILPYHKWIDGERERKRASTGGTLGTTGRGIGPTYASKAYRDGPRICDLIAEGGLEKWFQVNPHLEEAMTAELRQSYQKAADILRPFVGDVAQKTWDILDKKESVLLEGAQGAMLDVNFGTYPYVTSSNLVAGACPAGLGIPPWKLTNVLGVIKAYTTRVGQGPYPGELFGALEEELRQKGKEFGSTTGRARRVGWLDLVSLKYLARLCGMTGWALMKSDVLDGFEHVGIVVAYRNKTTGLPMSSYPVRWEEWDAVEPVVEFCQGWKSVVDSTSKLSAPLGQFVEKIEKHTGVPVTYVSSGPERSQGVWVKGGASAN